MPLPAPAVAAAPVVARERPVVVLTGYPSLAARLTLDALVAEQPDLRVLLFVDAAALPDAREALRTAGHARLDAALVACDPGADDWGLGVSGGDVVADATRIIHLGALGRLDMPRDAALRAGIDATRTLVRWAAGARRNPGVTLTSTVYVAGTREGTWRERDLEAGQGFRNAWEEALFRMERERARDEGGPLIDILRIGLPTGDSVTGRFDAGDAGARLIADWSEPGRRLHVTSGLDGEAPATTALDTLARTAARVVPDRPRRVLHILDAEPPPLALLTSVIDRAVGADRFTLGLPRGVWGGLKALGLISAATGVHATLTPYLTRGPRFDDSASRLVTAAAGVAPAVLTTYAPLIARRARPGTPRLAG